MIEAALAPTRRSVRQVQRTLAAAYRLDLEVEASRHLLSIEQARRLLPDTSPRSGVLACEDAGELYLGLYFDPRDARDPGTVVEETSHFVCLAWHAAQDRPVSALVLELQSEIDRYVVARLAGGPAFAHFEAFAFADWMDGETLGRYRRAHTAGACYCQGLESRYPTRADLPQLLAELRRFYRAPGPTKLCWAAAGQVG